MIHFDGSKLAEAFSNGGIYVHSDPYLGYRFVDGKIAEDVFTIDYLAPVEFRQDRETGTISFENIVDPEFAGLVHVMPEGTDSFKNYRTYGSFRYTDHVSAELLNMSYGEKYYTYKVQNGDGKSFMGQLAELGDCAVAKNGFSILTGPAHGSVAFGDNTVVFQVSVPDAQVLDVVLYPPKHISAPKGDVVPVTTESKMETQGVVDAVEKHPSGSGHEPGTSAEVDVLPLPVEASKPASVPQEHTIAPEEQPQTPESEPTSGAPANQGMQQPAPPSEVSEMPKSNVVDDGPTEDRDSQDNNDHVSEELHDAGKSGYSRIVGWLRSIFS